MKVQNKVCTIEQARELINFGILHTAEHFWIDTSLSKRPYWHVAHISQLKTLGNDVIYFDEHSTTKVNGRILPAYDVAELGVMLPSHEEGNALYCTLKDIDANDVKGFTAWFFRSENNLNEQVFPTEAQARAALLIHLLENKIHTPDEINVLIYESTK